VLAAARDWFLRAHLARDEFLNFHNRESAGGALSLIVDGVVLDTKLDESSQRVNEYALNKF
jgi:hypothetical protein